MRCLDTNFSGRLIFSGHFSENRTYRVLGKAQAQWETREKVQTKTIKDSASYCMHPFISHLVNESFFFDFFPTECRTKKVAKPMPGRSETVLKNLADNLQKTNKKGRGARPRAHVRLHIHTREHLIPFLLCTETSQIKIWVFTVPRIRFEDL